MSTDKIHASFILAAEFREKIQRSKEDLGATGNFFSCETLRGIYDFPVRDLAYFQNEQINPYDVILVRGRVCMRTDRVILEPTEFIVAESPELMKQAEMLIEYGRVSGDGLVSRNPYPDRVNNVDVPRVEVKFYGFRDQLVDEALFMSLPKNKESVLMHYSARLALDVQYTRQANGLNRRNTWVISGQQIEPIKQVARREKAEN